MLLPPATLLRTKISFSLFTEECWNQSLLLLLSPHDTGHLHLQESCIMITGRPTVQDVQAHVKKGCFFVFLTCFGPAVPTVHVNYSDISP